MLGGISIYILSLMPNGKPPSLGSSLGPSKRFRTYLRGLCKKLPTKILPLSLLASSLPPFKFTSPTRKTHIMAILNLTPDSFSDGGHHPSNPLDLLPILQSMISNGVTIVDIGGQSTRPNAPQCSSSEELNRILPTIQYIRSKPEFNNLAISVDTYRASVATAAIEAGANIINDVSAGTLDPDMLPTAAKLGCTVVLMHMRGNPSTMTGLTDYPEGVIEGVKEELSARIRAAEETGIFRWRIILDPGIGFAKTQAQNLKVLRSFSQLRKGNKLPWLVGTSRKSFIGNITDVKSPENRLLGTVACVVSVMAQGADIVRVHDFKEMRSVAIMGDAIWRQKEV